MRITRVSVFFVLICIGLGACTSIPGELATLHSKEREVIENLRISHLAMIDAFVDQKLSNFESFYFKEYGPAFRDNWFESFAENKGRAYDPERDFDLLYNDLVVEYQEAAAPIEETRRQLHESFEAEYKNALQAHDTIGRWHASLKKLNDSQRSAANELLGLLNADLSLEVLEGAFNNAVAGVQQRIQSLNE